MEEYLVDTNAVSHYLSGNLPELGMVFLDNVINAVPNLSIISQIELLTWNSTKNVVVKDFITDSFIFNISPEIVNICVTIRKGKKIKIPDAIIAATALVNGFTLVTDNEKDFEGIPTLKIINPKKL
ncbi:MAG: type II toxin-antitoxin system VapC family toxin [Dyadobacter sp.]|uniref:type II toxin-antitoxin system VapC family toxin n=1 Tax=Dyadobacter sp. TaxID=1914288 RepID=UPI0032675D76